jgi:hypothetical protein
MLKRRYSGSRVADFIAKARSNRLLTEQKITSLS